MIGYLTGEVLFSDGKEVVLKTKDGVGYQVYLQALLVEGAEAELFIAHVFRDAGQELFGFTTLRDKKLFELLTSVKGVGPKSAYSLISSLGSETVIQAIQLENKKTLSKAPGVGAKAAAQICLDLGNKIQNVLIYKGNKEGDFLSATEVRENIGEASNLSMFSSVHATPILEEALMACKELGFKEDLILAKAQKILNENDIQRPEQLVHLVLKEV